MRRWRSERNWDPTFSTLKDPRKYRLPQKFCGFGGDGSASGARLMSALPSKADKEQTSRFVRFVPKPDSCTATNGVHGVECSAATSLPVRLMSAFGHQLFQELQSSSKVAPYSS